MSVLIEKIKFRLRRIFFSPIPIPDPSLKRKRIDEIRQESKAEILVETGTFLGDTVEAFREKFREVYSIELSEDLANRAKKRFENKSNVHIIQGDSGSVLETLLPSLKAPTLFWLDGHYSSEFFIGDDYIKTAKGELNTPIIKELKLILESGIDSSILIDDARLFVGKDDYPTVGFIKNFVRKYSTNHVVTLDTDIIFILPKK